MSAWAMTALVATLAASPASRPGADLPDYPQPNPAEPVNYIEWINRTFDTGTGPNAAEVYGKAFEKLEPFEGDWGTAISSPWTDRKDVQQWLDRNQEGLRLFRQAAVMERCFFKSSSYNRADEREVHPRARHLLLNTTIPELSKLRLAIRAILAEAYGKAARGEFSALMDSGLLVIRSGRQFDKDPILLRRIVAMGCSAMGYAAVRHALAEFQPEHAHVASEQLNRIDPPHPSFHTAMLVERIMVLDFHQRLFKPTAKGPYWLVVPEVAEGFGETFRLDTFFVRSKVRAIGYDKTIRDVNEYFDRVQQWMELPDRAAPLDVDLREEFLAEHGDNVLLTLLPSFERSRGIWLKVEAERRATHLVAALLSMQIKPQTLDELRSVPAETRTDPFTGKPFVYRRIGEGFTLYSAGMDREDNGGDHDPKWGENEPGDYVFWPIPETKTPD
jgi:hypothetical protein